MGDEATGVTVGERARLSDVALLFLRLGVGRLDHRGHGRSRRVPSPSVQGELHVAHRRWGARRRRGAGSAMRRTLVAGAVASLSLATTASFAGPPYATDDPEPVEYHHWELYLASQHFRDRTAWSGTAPHFEVNYGVVPDVQLHAIAPLAYSAPDDGIAHYGYGDTEFGVKFRFLQERKWTPMVGTFPFLEIPSGSQGAGLGNGSALVFLPVWLQKSFGSWQTYGGAGVWIDLGDRDRHWWYFGWQVQRRICKALTLGAEVFHQTPKQHGGESDTRFNVGAVVDLSAVHHLLLSGGRGLDGPNLFQGYAAWLVTLGPAEDGAR
jgi:hypothetical protein